MAKSHLTTQALMNMLPYRDGTSHSQSEVTSKRIKMRYFIIIVILLLTTQYCRAQIDMLDDGLKTCLTEDEYKFVNELFHELESFAFQNLSIERDNYKALTNKFCQSNESRVYIIPENSKLSELIKNGIAKGFWIYEKYEPNNNNKYTINGDTVEIFPIGQSEYIPPPPDSIEQSYINPNHPYINCSKDYTFQKALNIIFQDYNKYKVASSIVKICPITELIRDSEYQTLSIKHYILLHCICQKIIHLNDYYKYFR